jgi:eukaryotic-like serine/threonine-protein kinase
MMPALHEQFAKTVSDFSYTESIEGDTSMGSAPDDTTHLIDPDQSADLAPENFLKNWEHYKIEVLLGQGGMGRVYKAFDPKLKRYVALKFVRTDNENLKKRFVREAKAQAQIEHDNVCKIFETGEVDGNPYIAMQLIQGEILTKILADLSIEQKVLIMEKIADAIQHAHRIGIIHRDIKPSNVIVERREDGSYRPFITDFGIAREISDPGMTATDVVVGTPSYMAPEQMTGHAVDRRTDVYGLGATMYYVFSGQPPFKGSGMEILAKLSSEDPIPLSKTASSIPSDLDVIVSKCLEKDPLRRYDSAKALADDLRKYLDGEPILARRASFAYRIKKKIKKNKAVATILAITFVIIFALAMFSIFSYWRAANQVKIARQFSQSVESMDWIMRVAYMSPLHDIRKEKDQVRKEMKEIQNMMDRSGAAAIGPGNFALGRGYLSLRNYDQARVHLEKALNAGYQSKEVANALGITLGALYKDELSEVNRIKDKETRKKKLLEIEKNYRDPAVRYLKQSSGLRTQSPELGEALLAYYEKNWDAALHLSRISIEKIPWLYEARMLEGDVFEQLGEESSQEGNFDLAKKKYKESAESYARAEEISRSNSELFKNQCTLFRGLLAVDTATGVDAKKDYESSADYCKKAILVDPEDASAYELSARTEWRHGETEYMSGQDPSSSFHAAIDFSQQALKLSPENARIYLTIGTANNYLADFESDSGKDPTKYIKEAIKSLEFSVQKDSSSAVAYASLGHSYLSQAATVRGEASTIPLQKAIDCYHKALEISPLHFGAQSNLANAYTSLGLIEKENGKDPTQYFEQSIKNFEKAIKINPNYWLIHTNLAAAYLEVVSYELDHGRDPTPKIEKALSECENGEKLKAGTPHAAVNSASANLYHAEYLLAQNKDPLPLTQKVEQLLTPIIGVHFVEVFTGLSDAKKIEAQYLVQKKQSPEAALKQSARYLNEAVKINAANPQVHKSMARLELIKADWLIQKGTSPDEVLKKAAESLNHALKLNPKFALAYAMLGEKALESAKWKIHLKQNADGDIQEGVASIQKALQLNSDIAEAYATMANLQLLQASIHKDRRSIISESIKNFERAFTINGLLRNKEAGNVQKAKNLL